VPGAAAGIASDAKHPDTLHQETLKGSFVSVPAGPEITKLPLSQISRSMSAYRPTAAVIGPNPHRPLQTENWAVAPLRLKSRSGRFAIKSPAFSDVCNAHVAAGRQAPCD